MSAPADPRLTDETVLSLCINQLIKIKVDLLSRNTRISFEEGIATSRFADHIYLLASGVAVSLQATQKTFKTLIQLVSRIREIVEWNYTTPHRELNK